MNYSFLSPLNIIIGENESLNLVKYVKPNQKVLLFHGKSIKSNNTFIKIIENLKDISDFDSYQIESGEPTPKMVDDAADFAKKIYADIIIGIGGGSVLDIAKAVCALATNEGNVIDYLEGVGTGKLVENQPLKFIAIPTTSGTGTEVTKNSVISSVEKSFKKSMRADSMIADITIIDYTLTMGLPKSITASSGMDAICQLIESYTTRHSNPITDALSLHHAKLTVGAIASAYENDDKNSREIMSVGAMVSGLCLANSGLGIAHGLAAGLGATLGIPHGYACGLLLPFAMEFNFKRGVKKYAALGEAFYNKKFDSEDIACKHAIKRIKELNKAVNIPSDLKKYNLTTDDIERAAKASMGSSMSKNPVEVTLDDCIDLLKKLV